MPNIINQISYMYIEYSTAFHLKFMHLFSDSIYDTEKVDKFPLVITWAETAMGVEEGNGKCLVIAAKTSYYEDRYKVTEELFEDALQAFFIFPDSSNDDEDSSKIRLEYVKALLNK